MAPRRIRRHYQCDPPVAGTLIDERREKKLFFCQIEAVETAIYITEVAKKYGDAWIENDRRAANDTSNPGLPRIAFKMATGSGKTVVMAMLIAWQALNKLEDRDNALFSDAFLLVTPRTLWVPAVNNHGGFGRWAFVEVTDPWDCEAVIRAAIAEAAHVQHA